ncbi:MAG: ribonuclease III [Lachnospiraceae bacterium]|nr:ribonuclease III [Lachnospiraceae bacterium]
METGILGSIKKEFGLKEVRVNEYSPLTLAFIGDCVFDLVVKTVVVETANCPANVLHKRTSNIVKANSQSRMAQWFVENDILSPEELSVFKRGRNAKSNTMAKNSSVGDYRRATGVEALIGYLYLNDRCERIVELIKLGMNVTLEKDSHKQTAK